MVEFAPSMAACVGEACCGGDRDRRGRNSRLSIRARLARETGARPVIFDWWHMLRPADFESVADYIACGQGPTMLGAGRLSTPLARSHFKR